MIKSTELITIMLQDEWCHDDLLENGIGSSVGNNQELLPSKKTKIIHIKKQNVTLAMAEVKVVELKLLAEKLSIKKIDFKTELGCLVSRWWLSDTDAELLFYPLFYALLRYTQALGASLLFFSQEGFSVDAFLASIKNKKVAEFILKENQFLTQGEMTKGLCWLNQGIDELNIKIDWQLGILQHSPKACFHGGDFFTAIGEQFDDLSRIDHVINADVLDAWFAPAPAIEQQLSKALPWLMRTSPPTHAAGLIQAIARARGIPAECVLPGGGSSALIFLAFRQWLNPSSKVLVLDPAYGEYIHVLENIIGCQVERLTLLREEGYQVNLQKLAQKLQQPLDLFIWVNPNSPTGLHVNKKDVKDLLQTAKKCRRIWIDETYIDYVAAAESLESFAANSDQVFVCKSMSKVYALSGMRVAYLCAANHQLEILRSLSPPWSVSMPAQLAAIYALLSVEYYQEKYQQTALLRVELITQLRRLGIQEIIPGQANFILCHLTKTMPTAADIVLQAKQQGLYLRDAKAMGSSLGDRALRIAVKDKATNKKIVAILASLLL